MKKKLLEFTLDKADLTIALQNALDENYFLPKEYDSTEDSKNPFVAAKGHTFVAFTFTAKNLDRASVTPYEYGDVSDFISVIYNGKSYTSDIEYGFRNDNDEGWRTDGGSSLQIVLLPGEQTSRRCYFDIPVEVTDLSDTFSIKFSLPDSGGERVDYVYTVTPERK